MFCYIMLCYVLLYNLSLHGKITNFTFTEARSMSVSKIKCTFGSERYLSPKVKDPGTNFRSRSGTSEAVGSGRLAAKAVPSISYFYTLAPSLDLVPPLPYTQALKLGKWIDSINFQLSPTISMQQECTDHHPPPPNLMYLCWHFPGARLRVR